METQWTFDELVEIKGQFTGFRTKNYPGAFPPKVEKLIRSIAESPCLHLFSGTSSIGDVRVDIERPEATDNLDVFDFIRRDKRVWQFVVADPPYDVPAGIERHRIDKVYGISVALNNLRQSELCKYLKGHAENVLWFDVTAPRPKGFYRYKEWLFHPGGFHHVRVLSWLKHEGNLRRYL